MNSAGVPRFQHVPLENVPVFDKLKVLHVSFDRPLLVTRSAILEREGFQVLNAGTGEQAMHVCDRHTLHAVVIDHTVPARQREALIKACRGSRSNPRIICLYRSSRDEATAADVRIDSHDGPRVLIEALRQLKRPPRPTAGERHR